MGSQGTMIDAAQALAACACPRTEGGNLAAPRCAADWYTGGTDGSLFLKSPVDTACGYLRVLSYGQFCLCRNRLKVYLNHGI